MIRVSNQPDGAVLLEVELVRQPAIYLDHDSLTDIARTPARRQRFLDIWTRKGELLFSFVNALENTRSNCRSVSHRASRVDLHSSRRLAR